MTSQPDPPDAPVAGTPPPADESMRTERTAGVVRAGGMMAVATLISRATGFISKVFILAFLGFSVSKDSYELANTLPNIIFELLLGGVLASVAIPLLSRARSDPDGGRRYTQQLMTLTLVGLAAATVLAVAAAPLLTRLYFDSGDNVDLSLATNLAYLLLPQIFFYGIAALFGAILNTKERFAAPAWAPVANNLVVIVVGVILLVTSGTTEGGLTSLTRGQLLLLGVGTTAGIVIQALILLPALHRSGFRFGWRWGVDQRMREAGALMAWAVAYALVSQVGYIVIVRISRNTEDGFYGLYTYGSMLFQLPYGILGVSLLTAIMPRMSRHAAAGDMPAVKKDMALANRLSAVALLPVTAVMISLAIPLAIVSARYGSVTAENARILAVTLAAFAVGLLPLAITLVQMRVFYAMKDGRTPTIINAIMVAVRIPMLLACLALPHSWVVPGLALAMSLSYVVGVAVGEIWLHARFGTMGFTATLSVIARAGVASAAGGAAAWGVVRLVNADTASGSLVSSLGVLVLGGAVGLGVMFLGLMALRVDEAEALLRMGRSLVKRLAGKVTGRIAGGAAARADDDRRGTMEPRGGRPQDDPQQDDPQQQREQQEQEPVTEQSNPRDEHAAVPTPPSIPAASHTPGMIVGERYRLTRLIAVDENAGAPRAEFWLARDTVLPRDMAVTILPQTDPTSPTVTGTLRVGRLHHPGLPQILDVGAVGTGSYLAGQWTDGATLADLVADGPLESAIAGRMAASIAATLADVHRSGARLGFVHPTLVRVGMDGTVRLSHVVARSGATEDDDVRALGALSYLMLTATWPGPQDQVPAGLRPAPRRGATELPAAKAVAGASSELSRLTERALRGGVRGIGLDEFAEAAAAVGGERPTVTPAHEPRSAVRHSAMVAQTTPLAVRRDRRVKLAIAGTMLLALSVLIVIMVSSVTKQVLANIVAPIEAADNQELVSVSPFTTTRTVAGTTTSQVGTTTEEPVTTPPEPVTIVGATVYDPQGEPPADYESSVDQAFDGNIATAWPTWVYRQQFGPGGIKDGVGLVLTLAEDVSPTSVTLATTMANTVVEVRTAATAEPALDDTAVLGTATLGADPVTITLSNAPSSKFLIVWITQLADYQGGSEANQGQFQSDLSEISVTG